MPTSKKSATHSARPSRDASKAGTSRKEKSATPVVQKSLSKYRSKRNFSVTAEPSGEKEQAPNPEALRFVIQKHAASHLHFDLRLEVDGVMKSWAVPKGPSVDPDIKRLAMEVEDHPVAYNTFEGTIPPGEYGGGTVMLWDRGKYSPDEIDSGEDANAAAKRALASGKLAFTFHGERLQGSYALVRTRRGEERAQWLLIKHKDRFAKAGQDIVAKVMTSVDTARTMEEIAAANSDEPNALDEMGAVAPMEPTLAPASVPAGEYAITEEPEGKRVFAFLTSGTVKLTANAGSKNFDSAAALEGSPNAAAALLRMARKIEGAVILDGYLSPDEFVVADVLLVGNDLQVEEPWIARQTSLESLLDSQSTGTKSGTAALFPMPWVASTAEHVHSSSAEIGAPSIIAKRIDSPYESGASKYWLRVSL
ncbi:MAG: hypothetical protein H7Z40_23450 [Phycisphaerae bacterium]|nr:hypothetical protein [Gemmatimonadaceae bacterium]